VVEVQTAWLKCWALVWLLQDGCQRVAQIGFKFNICPFPVRLFVMCRIVELVDLQAHVLAVNIK
jgi:hypothetical protein